MTYHLRVTSRCLATLALATVLALAPLSSTVAEPVIVAPQSVPIGGLCIVRVDGLEDNAKFSWQAIPPDTQTADLMERDGRPVLFVATNRAGLVHLVLAYSDAAGIHQQLATVVIGGGPGPGPITPGPGPAPVEPGPQPTPQTVTAATFVYEKDQHAIPIQVLSALNKLNRGDYGPPGTRQPSILATVLEADTTDGTGEVPEQYKAILAAAKAAGLPCLIVSGPAGIIATVKNPTTEQQVLDAVPPPPAMRKAG